MKDKIIKMSSFFVLMGFPLFATAADSAVFNVDTGSNSVNIVKFSASEEIKAMIENNASVNNDVSLDANTGCNEADGNTGDGSVDTGDISGEVSVMNVLNKTEVMVPREGSTAALKIEANNTNTGFDSLNIAKIKSDIEQKIDIENDLDIDNDVELDANTGGNEANGNTGDGRVTTGNITLMTMLENIGNTVKVVIEGCCPGEEGEEGEGGGVSPGNGEEGEGGGVSPESGGIGGGVLTFADSLGIGGGSLPDTLPVAGADQLMLILLLSAIGTILIVQILDKAEKAKLAS